MEVEAGAAALLAENLTGTIVTPVDYGGPTVEVASGPSHFLLTPRFIIGAIVYLLGAGGNTAALCYLFGIKSKPRNPKHALMLRCLVANDLVAMVGMLVQMIIKQVWPVVLGSRYFCGFRVLWRIFGLGSGCVVIVMAVERLFALTRPFFYQKHVTLSTIRRSIIFLWVVTLIIVCLPFLGFGAYFDEKKSLCIRYKLATQPLDKAYAYIYLSFGTLLCVCLVWCNVAVMRALVLSRQREDKRHAVLVRRISRNRDLTSNSSTTEEVAFAKIMGLLCVVFVLCWVPQLVTIPLALNYPENAKTFLIIADVLLALHFVVDPYFYILQRRPVFRSMCRRKRTGSSRANSMKTSNELCSL